MTTSVFSLTGNHWFITGKSSPFMAGMFRWVNYCNLPRWCWYPPEVITNGLNSRNGLALLCHTLIGKIYGLLCEWASIQFTLNVCFFTPEQFTLQVVLLLVPLCYYRQLWSHRPKLPPPQVCKKIIMTMIIDIIAIEIKSINFSWGTAKKSHTPYCHWVISVLTSHIPSIPLHIFITDPIPHCVVPPMWKSPTSTMLSGCSI